MRYLFIFEDGTFKAAATVSDSDLEAASDGSINIIDMTDGLFYQDGEWVELETI